jgi:hypothetical protein
MTAIVKADTSLDSRYKTPASWHATLLVQAISLFRKLPRNIWSAPAMIPQYTPISRLAAFKLVNKIVKLLSMDSL